MDLVEEQQYQPISIVSESDKEIAVKRNPHIKPAPSHVVKTPAGQQLYLYKSIHGVTWYEHASPNKAKGSEKEQLLKKSKRRKIIVEEEWLMEQYMDHILDPSDALLKYLYVKRVLKIYALVCIIL